ncbi:MAG: outer membrane beta-barrel protein [Bacteroides cellulosilyticus]
MPAIKGLYTEFGLQLSTKAHKSGLVIGFEYEYLQSTTDINYLNIPIHIGYKIKCSKSISLFANVGPYFGVGLWGKQKFYRDEKSFTLKVTFLVVNMGTKDSITVADSILV